MTQHNRFAVLYANILLSKQINHAEKLLIALIGNLSNEKGHCWASNNYLSKCLDLGERRIQQYLQRLEDIGAITRIIKVNSEKQVQYRALTVNYDADIFLFTQAPPADNEIIMDENSEETDNKPGEENFTTPPEGNFTTPLKKISPPPRNFLHHNIKDNIKELKSKYSFEDFWQAYDKKVGKKQAQDAWNKLPAGEKEKAYEGITNHTQGKEKKFWKDPVRYIKDKRWEDEPQYKQSQIKQAPAYDPKDPKNQW